MGSFLLFVAVLVVVAQLSCSFSNAFFTELAAAPSQSSFKLFSSTTSSYSGETKVSGRSIEFCVLRVACDCGLVLTKKTKILLSKAELLKLGESTNRGMSSSAGEKRRATEILESLSSSVSRPSGYNLDQQVGKWTLVYTDAPDITSLDKTPGGQLGRIGNEITEEGVVKNVIEWLRPRWVDRIPVPSAFRRALLGSSSDEANGRFLQKVVTKGKSREGEEEFVDLKVAGVEGYAEGADDDLPFILQRTKDQPIDIKGLAELPFGSFETKYLQDGIRIVKTNAGHWAVSVKNDDSSAWF